MKKLTTKIASAALVAAMAAAPAYAEQGVTDTEVLIGSNNDLSGPFAAFGAPATKAAQLVFDEVNEAGGIHGRKIRFVVEDHAYQMPKAIQGMNKLINGDKVFAMLLSLGTPMNIAAFKLQDAKNIPNVSPLSAARQMAEPFSPLHYAGTATYYEQIRVGVKYLAEQKGVGNVCAMYLPTDFGKDIKEGAESISAETDGLTYVTETTHKPDDADFVGALQKLSAEGCEIVALALGVRQAITVSGTAKKLGLSGMSFINSSAGFHTVMAKVPGGVTEGMYAAAGWADLLSRMDKPEVQKFFARYTEATGEQLPGSGALLGHSAAETLVKALEAAGPDLNAKSFQMGMESLNYEDVVSGNTVTYSATDHQGADEVVISVIKDGNWMELARQ
ncbi:ABC transporter substrate-binding protein [Sulfitobacter mediterraneus]|uniref:ABC transporter substrate-binding protein n=1 Tax=Sulfitobacter mediterraneus TaxID=83219 RepID=UPI00193176BE|nr:ABC transporter substrate-binding protein [Sulfitobacter mediterraneus]MBM1311009.1 ABC transporter substrate-binding protein [Sulfitobacter mediterraneus]MBM1314892.1 ABC transporter substrate-binding protein [Sulfitobacter mediterraneus]MBM1323252.1 ABC transporter substrate-binding protein [Sulfitobacter mediterraneus]MBM1327164.1 ABC transporter substrate-binding protein [Sulfitobacter mediterraneus]MBM1398511.1 ABC transporter substrate-binding protein [Sulfitobacter mediterraneus]